MREMYICQSDETPLSILHAPAIAEGVVVTSFAARCSKQQAADSSPNACRRVVQMQLQARNTNQPSRVLTKRRIV